MQKLISGLHHFQNNVFSTKKELFERLAKQQQPETMFITCADSRVVPNLITHTEPGDLFVLRNAGNIVPPNSKRGGGEAATIEYAVNVLNVKDIVICGHTECGAIGGLLNPKSLKDLPFVKSWLKHSQKAKVLVEANYSKLSPAEKLNVTTQENVLVQVENLKSLPAVAAALEQGRLKIHAWIYKIETGQVFSFDSVKGQFEAVTEQEDSRPSSPDVQQPSPSSRELPNSVELRNSLRSV